MEETEVSLLQEESEIATSESCKQDQHPKPQTHRDVWKALNDEHDLIRSEIEQYNLKKKKNHDVPPNPYVHFLDVEIFPLLSVALIDTLQQAQEKDSLERHKTPFDGIDYIAEYLWNKNHRHPERRGNHIYIFDMDWVNNFLSIKPRPFIPFHRIWSKNFAAIKIQSFMKGYWVRRRENVQEVRQFWKHLKASKICMCDLLPEKHKYKHHFEQEPEATTPS